jgi:hypothetical protein
MANATANMQVIRKIESVTLTLNENEVNTLYAILRRIGGDPKYSPRKHADSMLEAICDAMNIENSAYCEYTPKESTRISDKYRSIYFEKYED